MTAPAEPAADWDLPAVPGDDFAPHWDKELTGPRAALLQEFAEWVRSEGLPETPDSDLVKFIHSCDYELDRAKKCAKDYYWSRNAVPELFSDWDASLPNLQTAFETVSFAIMPRRTPDNFRVLITALKTSDTTNYVIPDVMKVNVMAVETIFLTEPTIAGIVLISDIQNMTFSHIWKFLWNINRKMQVYFEDGVPLKREKVHLINCPNFIDKGMRLMSRVMRQEDRDKMVTHAGSDYSELHTFVPRECLPSDYGGTLPSLEKLHDMSLQRLLDFKDIFEKISPGYKR